MCKIVQNSPVIYVQVTLHCINLVTLSLIFWLIFILLYVMFFTCRSFDVAYNTYQNVGLTVLNSQAQQQVTFKLYVYYQWLFFLYLYPVQSGYEWAWPLSLSNNLNIKIRLQEKFWPQCWRDEGVKSHNSMKLMRMKNLFLEFHFYIWILLLYLGQKCGVSLSYHVTN